MKKLSRVEREELMAWKMIIASKSCQTTFSNKIQGIIRTLLKRILQLLIIIYKGTKIIETGFGKKVKCLNNTWWLKTWILSLAVNTTTIFSTTEVWYSVRAAIATKGINKLQHKFPKQTAMTLTYSAQRSSQMKTIYTDITPWTLLKSIRTN